MKKLLPVLAIWILAVVGGAVAAAASPNALVELERRDPEAALRLDPMMRALLGQLTTEQVGALRSGADPKSIELADGRSLHDFLVEQLGVGTYAIPFFTMDGGGGQSLGGTFRVVGTAGQPDAGNHSGGPFVLLGGFWPALLGSLPTSLFSDGFESGNLGAWSGVSQ